jgi:predicted ester cyclase
MTNHEREQAHMRTVRTLAEQVFSMGKVDLLPELLHAEYEDHSAAEGLRDRDGFRKIVEFWRGRTSGFNVRVDRIFASGDFVGMVDETSGVHDKSDLFGVPPNGQSFRFEVVHAFRFSEGRLREHWVQTALPDVLRRWTSAK